MKRSPLKRRSVLKPVSDKRRAQRDDYNAAVTEAFRRDRGLCRGLGVIPGHVCEGRLDPHHVWPVGNGGPRCDPANIVVLCRRAHDWAHGNPLLSKPAGLLR